MRAELSCWDSSGSGGCRDPAPWGRPPCGTVAGHKQGLQKQLMGVSSRCQDQEGGAGGAYTEVVGTVSFVQRQRQLLCCGLVQLRVSRD